MNTAGDNKNITFNHAQVMVDDWIKTIGVRYFNELTNMVVLTEEVGELARIVARRYGEQSEKESDKNLDLGDEIADVLWVLICLANQTGIDLEAAFIKNLEKKISVIKIDIERIKNYDELSLIPDFAVGTYFKIWVNTSSMNDQ